MREIYFDHNASTPMLPEVVEAMARFASSEFGNPSSVHFLGRRAKSALEGARAEVAKLVGCDPSELIFTSGGTEANNLAIQGTLALAPSDRRRFITSSIEHKSVLSVAHALEGRGFRVSFLPVDRFGRVDLSALERELRPGAALVSIMHANNEVGTLQD